MVCSIHHVRMLFLNSRAHVVFRVAQGDVTAEAAYYKLLD